MLCRVWKETGEINEVVYLGMDSACRTGLVRVVAKNEEGRPRSTLAYIGPDGIRRAPNVPSSLGFKRDESGGRIVLRDDPLLEQLKGEYRCSHCGCTTK